VDAEVIMDTVALLKQVVDETDRLVTNIGPEDLTASTPCTEWSVRDLINHITGGATMFAMSAESGSVPDEVLGQLIGGDNLGDDYKGAWGIASKRALAAFEQPGVMEKIVKLPFGEMPAGVALSIAVFDVATHATDLALATGQTIDNDELLEGALAMGKQMIGSDMRNTGLFLDEQSIGADAPVIDRLQAFAGRKV
jgi:uncharacterized protein (TIGR03086 family)